MIKSVREFLVDIAENEPLTLEELRQMDGEPVRHGIWTSIADGDMAECSECGECYDTETEGVIEFSKFYRFCPSCGAKMDGDMNE